MGVPLTPPPPVGGATVAFCGLSLGLVGAVSVGAGVFCAGAGIGAGETDFAGFLGYGLGVGLGASTGILGTGGAAVFGGACGASGATRLAMTRSSF